MVAGIAGGLIMTGLLAGAILGSVWFLLGFTAVGLLVAGLSYAAASYKERAAASCKLAQYPPYGY